MTPDCKITSIASEAEIPGALLELYREAFPPEERRPWSDTEEMGQFMRANPLMHVKTIETNGDFAGFMIYWSLTKNLVYVEHLATLPHLRGNGLGAKLLTSLRTDPDTQILLEVEPPADELTRRRVGFYNRLGLVLHHDLAYTQPPYFPGGLPVDLCLMTTPGVGDSELAEKIVPVLHETVYFHKL